MQKKIMLIAGARPNYMKVFPIWKALKQREDTFTPLLVHTGQHYDSVMSDVFFHDFGMEQPDYFLGVGSGTHGVQTAKALEKIEEVLIKENPHALVVVGDVNSTAAGALAASKLHIPTAHVEAGLRSRDRFMPEEINRLVTDAIADILLTPSPDADENLRAEGIPEERIRCVGNVMIDSLIMMEDKVFPPALLQEKKIPDGGYIAVTLHRPSNVDDPAKLSYILENLNRLASRMPVVFPAHPRTRKMIDKLSFTPHDQLFLSPPLGYLEFMGLTRGAALVLTDSGGIQEETSFLGIPCLTARENTERPITIELGTNQLVDPTDPGLLERVGRAIQKKPETPPKIPLWDGKAAKRIADALSSLTFH